MTTADVLVGWSTSVVDVAFDDKVLTLERLDGHAKPEFDPTAGLLGISAWLDPIGDEAGDEDTGAETCTAGLEARVVCAPDKEGNTAVAVTFPVPVPTEQERPPDAVEVG